MRNTTHTRLALQPLVLCLTLALAARSQTASSDNPPQSAALKISLGIHRIFPSDSANDAAGRIYEQFELTVENTAKDPKDLYKLADPTRRPWQVKLFRQGDRGKVLLPVRWCDPQPPTSEIAAGQAVRTTAKWDITSSAEPGTYEVEVEFLPSGDKATGTFEIWPALDQKIRFTGKLMGYFRLPNHQVSESFSPGNPCPIPDDGESRASRDAREFINISKLWTDDANAILVGTGDNFAPNYYSRVMEKAENTDQGNTKRLRFAGKDLFDWDAEVNQWTSYADPSPATEAKLDLGTATIPTDNVACFLSYVKYDALVPGKQDFYYGPERLRQLARFLASVRDAGHFQPVQMLAANMFIKTTWAKDHTPIPDTGKRPLAFVTKFSYVPEPPDASAGVKPEAVYRNLEIADFTD